MGRKRLSDKQMADLRRALRDSLRPPLDAIQNDLREPRLERALERESSLRAKIERLEARVSVLEARRS
jgi:hypothetical protein